MSAKRRLKRTKAAKRVAKHARAKSRTVPRTKGGARAQPMIHAPDIESLLVDKTLSAQSTPANGTAIENLIYNATPKVADIGYSFGFYIGREIYEKQIGEKKFIEMLEKIGLPDSLYYPLSDRLIITSKPHAKKVSNIGKNMHVYEAGLISGYLSMSTGLRMNTTEPRCIYNGSDVCQFVAMPASKRAEEKQVALHYIVNSIASEIITSDYKKLRNEYYRILSFLPLLQQPMFEQVRKLLVMSGERIAEHTGPQDTKRIINNIANYFGARQAQIYLRRSGKSIIKLRYESYNSVYPYVSMPAALIVGYISRAYAKNAEISITTNKDKTYTTTIDFKN